MKIATLVAISLGLIMYGGPTIVQAQPTPPPAETTAPKPGMAELQDAIKRDPKNLDAYYDLANYYSKDEPDEVVKIFDRVIAIAPSNPEIYEKFAIIATDYEYQGAPMNAIIDRLITAQKNFPKSPQISIHLAGLYSYSKQPDQAIAALQQGLKNGGDRKEFNLMIGNIELVLNNKPDRALRYYQNVAKIGGDYLCQSLYGFSSFMEPLVSQGKALEAFGLLKSTLQQSSGEAQSNCIMNLYQLSDLHRPLRKETIALVRPIILAEKEIKSVELMELTNRMVEEKQYADVIALGDRLLAEKRSVPFLSMFAIAQSAKELKDFEKAEKWYLDAEALSAKRRIPKSTTAANSYPKLLSRVRWHIGTIRLAQGKTDEAIEQFKLSISTQAFSTPESINGESVSYKAIAHNSLGEIYLSQGKLKDAQSHFESSIKESKNLYAAPKQNLAKLRSQLK